MQRYQILFDTHRSIDLVERSVSPFVYVKGWVSICGSYGFGMPKNGKDIRYFVEKKTIPIRTSVIEMSNNAEYGQLNKH